jgi:AcrR family transcriptional regulator
VTASGEPDPQSGRGSAKARETQAALLALAADLFAEDGYQQTSIRDIARRAGVTTGAIYGHFRNKADLLVEAIHQGTTEELEARTMGLGEDTDYVDTLTRVAREYPERRHLRALILQGAAAAPTDEETGRRLREEQLEHLDAWIAGYERERERLGIDPTLDIPTAVLMTWIVELGLGVLEAIGIEPTSSAVWADVVNRLARSFQLPPAQ